MRTGRLEGQLGMDAALERAGDAWATKARNAIKGFCKFRVKFTADDLIAAVGMPPGTSHNAVGAAFNAASREHLIVDTGTTSRSVRPDAHGRKQTVWRAA